MDKVFSLTEGNESFFFRGQADSDWYLLPSLIRSNPYLLHSKDIYEKVEKYNKDNINLKSEDFLSKMVFFQHYGIPTCLLDWTTNALIALFFAVSAEYKKDGMVFLAKPDRIIKNDSGEWQIQSQLFELRERTVQELKTKDLKSVLSGLVEWTNGWVDISHLDAIIAAQQTSRAS